MHGLVVFNMVKFGGVTTMITPPQYQLDAAFEAGRQSLNDYSTFDSSMVPDDVLETFVIAVVTAALNATPSQTRQSKRGVKK